MKKKKTQRMFTGIDFSEIIEWLGIDMDEHEEKEAIKLAKIEIEKLRLKLGRDGYLDGSDKETIRKVEGIRTYVRICSEREIDYSNKIWKGLYETEHDSTFLVYVSLLLEYMWY
jgi:hypothetical protein